MLAVTSARIVRTDRVGRDATTLRVLLEGEGGGPRLKAMLFRGADGPIGQALATCATPVHLAGHLRAEEWNGTTSACFVISDAAPS